MIFRHYGDLFVQAYIPERVYQKYIGMIDKKSNATKLALIGY
ncbi:hypothetical protein ACN7JH_05770 [Aerococcus viridans]